MTQSIADMPMGNIQVYSWSWCIGLCDLKQISQSTIQGIDNFAKYFSFRRGNSQQGAAKLTIAQRK